MTTSSPRPLKALSLALLWGVVLGLLCVFLGVRFTSQTIETDVLKLLPATPTAPVWQRAESTFLKRLDRQVLVATTADTAHARLLEALIRREPAVEWVAGEVTPATQNYWGYRLRENALALLALDEKTNQLLDNPARYERWLKAQAYSPLSGASAREVANDPFLMVRRLWMKGAPSALTLKDGWLTGDFEGKTWRLIEVTLKPNTSDEAFESLANTIEQYDSDHPQIEIARQGSRFYSIWAQRQAQRDMTVLGSASLVLLTLLLWVAFRSWRALGLCFIAVGAGAVAGLSAVVALFGTLHAVTLVMCLSLIGLATDYTTYYLAARQHRTDPKESAWRTLARLRPSLLHAFLSTLVAYALLLWAPFPGLRQLALFAVAGLSAAWMTVMVLFPFFVESVPARSLPASRFWTGLVGLWTQKRQWMVGAVALFSVLVAIALTHVRVDDGLGTLSEAPADLARDEAVIKGLLKEDFSQTWLVVKAPTPTALFNRVDALRPELDQLVKDGALQGWRVPLFAGELAQKKLFEKVEALSPEVKRLWTGLGFSVETPRYFVTDVYHWVLTPQGRLLSLTFGALDREWALMIPARGVNDSARIGAWTKEKGLGWVHRRALLEASFATTRTLLTTLIAVAWGAIALGFLWRFGLKRGAMAALSVLLALLSAVAVSVPLGISLNLFSLFALILVLGISVDYAVFFSSMIKSPTPVLFAMGVALATTLVSLGILLLSQTPAVANFGWVLTAGVVVAFFTAPLSLLFPHD